MARTLTDLARLRRTEALAAARTALVLAADGDPDVRVEFEGDAAMVALGRGRYVNRVIGLGPEVEEDGIERIETFYDEGGLEPSVQLTAHVGAETTRRFRERGFHVDWFRSVFAAPIADLVLDPTPTDGDVAPVPMCPVDDALVDDWLDVLAVGNGATSADARTTSDRFAVAARASGPSAEILAFADGRAVACGSVLIVDGVAWFGGAATRPAYRGRGLQRALIRRRVEIAAEHGCDVVAATALPANSSARNLRRAGLDLVDMQVVVTRFQAPAGEPSVNRRA